MLCTKKILSNIRYISFLILGMVLNISWFWWFWFAQNANTENDCAISINNITPSSTIQDFGIITSNDILYIYNNLQKVCKWNQNQNWYSDNSYILQMYKTIVKDKFLLANTDYTISFDTPIVSDIWAKKRYDTKISYYKENKWLNPLQIKWDFDDIRKYWIYTNAINSDTCVYKSDNTKWLYNKLYNTCDMTYCMRAKIITKDMDSNIINSEYESCKSYIDQIINEELTRTQQMIIKYSTKITNDNLDTYINKYIWFKMINLQILQDKLDWLVNFLFKKITFTKDCKA